MSQKKKVVIGGINGRMGRASSRLLLDSDEFEIVGAYGKPDASYVGQDLGTLLALPTTGIEISKNFQSACAKTKPDIVLDNSVTAHSVEVAKSGINEGIRPVIGTSGIPESALSEISALSKQKKVGALIIPNFSIGAVLMMDFARQAGEYFGNVEIVEMHHTKKLDAPSGTAMHTTKKLAASRAEYNIKEVDEHEILTGSRGGLGQSGVRVHSLRLPGLISHQEVIFGSPGELLTVRHDSFNMDCFLQGIMMSLKFVSSIDELVIGLDIVLGLGNSAKKEHAVSASSK